jgi:hypothetical protein
MLERMSSYFCLFNASFDGPFGEQDVFVGRLMCAGRGWWPGAVGGTTAAGDLEL